MSKLSQKRRADATAVLGYLASIAAIFALAFISLPAEAAKRRGKTSAQHSRVEGPLTLVVSLRRQRVTVFDKHGKVTSAPVSTGRPGHRTPTGVFSILQKRRRHYSNLYGGASMPNMQRITWSGVALHAGQLPGYPASHGCIRMPYGFSNSLFSMTEVGTRVIVTQSDAAPEVIKHEALLKPLPPGDPVVYSIPPPGSAEEARKQRSSAANMLLGITPAEAEEYEGLPSGVERTRAAVEAYRLHEIELLEAAAKKADAVHQDTGAEVKVANEHLLDEIKRERILQPESTQIDGRIAAAREALAAAKRNFRDFILRSSTFVGDEALATAALEEDALEADALRHMAELDLANADRIALDKLLTERQEAITKAKDRRDVLKERFVSAGKALLNARQRLKEAKTAYERRDRPITVLLSKHDGKLYVRQGYDPVFKTDIEFENPDAPIGTHLFHATGYTEDGANLTWQATIAAQKSQGGRRSKRSSRKTKKPPLDPSWPDQTPANALNRVKIPNEVREKLAELVKPGSAMIISDERKSYETGKYTDLIVLTY
jgi:L,D-transpeptidase catalytic domain